MGDSNTRLYNIWGCMKQRCCNPRNPRYGRYGGRGIMVCDEWLHSFEKFKEWSISNGYEDGLQIDRIDNDGNYEPNNCRWVTREKNIEYRVADYNRRVALRDAENEKWIANHENMLRKYIKKYRQ